MTEIKEITTKKTSKVEKKRYETLGEEKFLEESVKFFKNIAKNFVKPDPIGNRQIGC